MRIRALIVAAATGLAIASLPAAADATPTSGARIQKWLAGHLASMSTSTATVLVHGTSTGTAPRAARASGLKVLGTLASIDVAVARGSRAQIRSVAHRSGVTYLEGDQPLEYALATSNMATRGDEARRTLKGADGGALDGRGVSVAI